MYLGLSLSHDSSAALVSDEGVVISAIAEERISRKKNHIGIPVEAIRNLLSENTGQVTEVVIGSHNLLDGYYVDRLLSSLEGNPSTPNGSGFEPWPGYDRKKNRLDSPKRVLENELLLIIGKDNFADAPRFHWINHHDSHLGCALGASEKDNSLLVSLDGSGDGESGAIAMLGMESGNLRFNSLARISAVDSLGNLYTAVTRRYNFKAAQHEGKITGLAAFGSYSQAVDVLINLVQVENGIPKIRYVSGLKGKILKVLVRQFGLPKQVLSSMDEIVSLAESESGRYEDLAFAIQHLLEKSVLEIIEYWITKTGINDVSLAGGVFANVKLNQRISDLQSVRSMNVFPNMGDGGIAIGGVWAHLSATNRIKVGQHQRFYQDMYLAPLENESQALPAHLDFLAIPESDIAREVAVDLANGRICAVHIGKMEFGPRALGNRSILIDPRNKSINDIVNKRLKRTEFMPFAPIVLEDSFDEYFETSNSTLQPFYFMASTCEVRKDKRLQIPAVTHVDGTARPQIINRAINGFIADILEEFKAITGIPVLVNTSFNVHEEPINYRMTDSLNALTRGAIDFIYTEDGKIFQV